MDDMKLTKRILTRLIIDTYCLDKVDALQLLGRICLLIRNNIQMDKQTKTELIWSITDCYYRMLDQDLQIKDKGGYDE